MKVEIRVFDKAVTLGPFDRVWQDGHSLTADGHILFTIEGHAFGGGCESCGPESETSVCFSPELASWFHLGAPELSHVIVKYLP